MSDKAAINRSVNTIRTELEYLRDAGAIAPPQYDSITAQLPQSGGVQSNYVDPRYAGGPPPNYNYGQFPSQIAQAAQDPNHPANPSHPKHHAWANGLGSKLGNAVVWGAGATAGGDIVNSIFNHV